MCCWNCSYILNSQRYLSNSSTNIWENFLNRVLTFFASHLVFTQDNTCWTGTAITLDGVRHKAEMTATSVVDVTRRVNCVDGMGQAKIKYTYISKLVMNLWKNFMTVSFLDNKNDLFKFEYCDVPLMRAQYKLEASWSLIDRSVSIACFQRHSFY